MVETSPNYVWLFVPLNGYALLDVVSELLLGIVRLLLDEVVLRKEVLFEGVECNAGFSVLKQVLRVKKLLHLIFRKLSFVFHDDALEKVRVSHETLPTEVHRRESLLCALVHFMQFPPKSVSDQAKHFGFFGAARLRSYVSYFNLLFVKLTIVLIRRSR